MTDQPGYCVFDTEGSGLFDYKRPAHDHDQPRLAEICMLLVTPDLVVEDQYQAYVLPHEWEMSDGATEANAITTELLMDHGIPIADVLDEYVKVIDEGRTFIAFNSAHDMKQMRGELRRAGRPDRYEDSPNICVMRALGPHCRIPRKAGNGWKWPTLTEALEHYGLKREGMLGARRDADACLKLFRKAVEIGAIPNASMS